MQNPLQSFSVSDNLHIPARNVHCIPYPIQNCPGKSTGNILKITLENLSPVFTPEQEAAKRRELEQQLYEVFRKYADKRQSEEAGA